MLTATGTVVEVEMVGDEVLVTVDLDVRTEDGRSTAPGSAVVALPLPPAAVAGR